MKADLILHHAHIYTVDSVKPWAEAVACKGGQIIAVGSNEEMRSLAGSDTQLINAKGRLVLPGLIDAHVHFLNYAIRQHEVNLFGVRDFEEVRQRVREAVESAGPDDWIQGWGWDESLWDVQPTKAGLDDLAPENPVVLRRIDMHTYWLNSAALKQAGLTRETSDPPSSQLERDEGGELTGILREWNALKLVDTHIPQPDHATLLTWLAEAIATAHQLGLTGIHDQRVQGEGRQSFRLFQTLQRQGKLNLRIHMNIAAEHLAEAATLGLQPGFGDDRLWIGHVKAFADGTLGSRTALMIEPYGDDPNNRGLAVTPTQALWELAEQARQAGFPLSIHAIGDSAVREIIDVFSELQPESITSAAPGQAQQMVMPPHRIEHVQVIHPDDLPRLNQHNIVASIQPVHICTDWAVANRVWGERARYAYAFRSLLEHGTRLALGSDAPVAPLDPMLGIYAAVTRQDQQGNPKNGWHPEERISVAEAVYGYTIGPAQAAGKARLQGSITPGKWADMIMLSQNIFEIPHDEIPETKLDLTVFDGQIVYHPGGEVDAARQKITFAPILGPKF
jgi:predicted amidohydrolase YtcJ